MKNYSVGAAETRDKQSFDGLFIPGLDKQVASFVKDIDSVDLDRTLVMMWIGSNNYLFDKNDQVTQTLGDIDLQSRKLLDQGVRHLSISQILELAGVPDTGKDNELLARLTQEHNQGLASLIETLRKDYPAATIYDLKPYQFAQSIILDGASFDIRNQTVPCYQGDLRGNWTDEKNCLRRLSWQSFVGLCPPELKGSMLLCQQLFS